MASPSELTGVTGNQARTRARQLRPDLAMVKTLSDRDTGAVVGRTVRGREKLFMSWEDMLFFLAGPRMGKAAALAIDMFVQPRARIHETDHVMRPPRKCTVQLHERGRKLLRQPRELIYFEEIRGPGTTRDRVQLACRAPSSCWGGGTDPSAHRIAVVTAIPLARTAVASVSGR